MVILPHFECQRGFFDELDDERYSDLRISWRQTARKADHKNLSLFSHEQADKNHDKNVGQKWSGKKQRIFQQGNNDPPLLLSGRTRYKIHL